MIMDEWRCTWRSTACVQPRVGETPRPIVTLGRLTGFSGRQLNSLRGRVHVPISIIARSKLPGSECTEYDLVMSKAA
jgi:hypothetical protein